MFVLTFLGHFDLTHSVTLFLFSSFSCIVQFAFLPPVVPAVPAVPRLSSPGFGIPLAELHAAWDKPFNAVNQGGCPQL